MTRTSRKLARVTDVCLPFVGVAVTLGAVVFIRENYNTQVALVGLGMVLIQLGVWQTARRLVPDQRRCLALRAEGDRFLELLRQLNAAALAVKSDDTPETHRVVEEISSTMRESIERMVAAAGAATGDLAAEEKPVVAMRQDPQPVGANAGD